MEELLIKRRNFIKTGGLAAAALAINPFEAMAAGDVVKLTILHTNDVHSRVEPFPMDGSRNQGLGGVARRAALIKRIRAEEQNVLLLDAGDIFQGTPYFNLYGGEVEMKLMTAMGYDAATMGNHDFDNGLEGFHKQLPHANFPIICSNYDFSNTLLKGATQPYKIFKKQGLKIGVFGVGIELKGLVEENNYGDTVYLNPVLKANEIAALLKKDLDCDLVICLSHLGYKYASAKVSDQVLAAQTSNIDLIIGGHTHTFMDVPEDVKNLSGGITTINQVGFAGINLGRVDYYFEKYKGKRAKAGAPYLINDLEA
ncbi:bifunctional metallophosphatase/5'-nucleotidase [Pedobacter psychroterrae]|uniref:Bifunctional metallophosphatase/5'-nucleotidase n=1 Tax=Pedobacter psychroterrae TaxID=2530453 RepID=A0A4R0NHR0_9SPHI|nr:metallophosphatase [Pedobacter psychroterrae]TCD00131.1 bifunctional metallophosphatase/5'-nucleotidase [Pedobacter psychroterrae]